MFGFPKRRKPSPTFRYTCSECGKAHEGPPSFSLPHPPGYDDAANGNGGAQLIIDTADCCVIDHGNDVIDRFIRATLEIPILESTDVFTWGLWVTHSKENFDHYHNTLEQDQSGKGAFGWLFTHFGPYADAPQGLRNLACDVCWQAKGMRPKITLQDGNHPLVHDQHNGITAARAIEIASALHHG